MDSLSFPAITIDEALAAGHALVVPNPRLTRILKQRLGLWQDPQARVLRTPPVFTADEWIDRQLGEWRLLGLWQQPLPQRLDELAERTLWEQVLAHCEDDEVLLDRDACAKLAMDTWRLVMRWAIPLDEGGIDEEEWVRFRRWLREFRQRCEAAGVADAQVWLQHFLNALRNTDIPPPAGPLVLVGFVEFTVQEAELFATLRDKGFPLLEAGLPQQAAGMRRVACASPDAEWLTAARWAQQYLQEHPGSQVAVLVNELGQHRERVAATFEAVFHPHALLQPGDDIERQYNLALGTPLADYPLVKTVLHWLPWLGRRDRPLPRAWITTALLLPFCRGSESEHALRARFDAWLRRQGHARLSLPLLREQLQRWCAAEAVQLPQLAALLDAVLALPAKGSASAQAAALLQALGWPGERPLLLSEQRTANALYRQLEAFDGVKPWLPKTLGPQLRWLQRQLRETLHQPSGSDNAPVQVLGLLDAVGRRFDAVWIANLTAGNWPAAPRPNPLIPQPWQHRIPHASSAREREYAEHLMRQLAGLAATVITSHAERHGDEAIDPSPLVAALPLLDLPDPLPAGLVGQLRRHAHFPDDPFQHPWLQWQADTHGLPLGDAERSRVRGGTGLFKAQAFCPLAGWAKRALAVQPLDAPDDDLDAAERGSLVHAALEHFWRAVADQASLLALAPAARVQQVAQAVEQAMQSFEARYRPLPPRYRALESGRLQAWLQDWLQYEEKRAPFSVRHCEQEVFLEFAGFRIRTLIDRVDELGDGSLLVIDYKTGRVTPDKWLGERIFDPQLPLYTQSQPQVAGALFALLRHDDMGWRGVVRERDWFPLQGRATQPAALQGWPDKKAEKSAFGAFADWAALSAFWAQRLTALADEIAGGHAAPVVFDESQLAYCEVRLLLRQPEVLLQQRLWDEQQARGEPA